MKKQGIPEVTASSSAIWKNSVPFKLKKENLKLIWEPKSAQFDFGEAEFYEEEKLCRKKYLAAPFPYNNDGYN